MSGTFQPFENLLPTLGSFCSSPDSALLENLRLTLPAHSHATGVLPALPLEVEAREKKAEGTERVADYHVPHEYIQDAGQSLPELATELVQAQNTQNKELQRREEELRKLQVK